MKKIRGYVVCSIIVILGIALTGYAFLTQTNMKKPKSFYQVYLDGEKVGLIDSETELYTLINKEQIKIKDEYKVDQVYPPKGFKIVEKNTYHDDITTVKTVYDSIKNKKQFTIKGYTISIKSNLEGTEPIYINVLDKKIFEEALKNVVTIFVGSDRYKDYLDGTQAPIVDVGYIIEKMYFKQKITVKESYISTEEKIYKDVDDLTRYLMFGESISKKPYIVQQGDTLEKIALSHDLNVGELMIANRDIKTENTLLAIGQELNVALINPVLQLVYEEYVVADSPVQYEKEIRKDPTHYVGYKETIQKGVNGIIRTTRRVQYVNGEMMSGVYEVQDGAPDQVIRPVQNEIVAVGTKRRQYDRPEQGIYVDTGAAWAWPTNSPYTITSPYGPRWGTFHDGVDIAPKGGYGQPIYAILDGVVVQARWGGMVGNCAGKNVVVKHDNGYYSVYAHASKLYVKAGDKVQRRQKIAAVGATGCTTGPHLHLGIFVGGPPYGGGHRINPMRLWN